MTMKLYKEHFGKRLKDALDLSGMKQVQLAEKLEVEPPTVSRWIRGIDMPEEWRISKIAETLNVHEEFFGFENSHRELTAKELCDFYFENEEIIPLIPKIPKDVLKLLSSQDETYFSSLRRILEGLEEKKKKSLPAKKAT